MSSLGDINDHSNHYHIPSTPNYSEVYSEHIVKHPVNITKHEDRILVICLTSFTFFVQVSQIIRLFPNIITTQVQLFLKSLKVCF